MSKNKKRAKERLHSVRQAQKQNTTAALQEEKLQFKGHKALAVAVGIFLSYTISTIGLKFVMDLRTVWGTWGILSFIILAGGIAVYIFALFHLSRFFIKKLEPISYNFFKKRRLRKMKKQEAKQKKKRQKMIKKLGLAKSSK